MHIGLADDAPARGEYTLDDVGVTLRGRSIREGTAGRSGPIRGDMDGVLDGMVGAFISPPSVKVLTNSFMWLIQKRAIGDAD